MQDVINPDAGIKTINRLATAVIVRAFQDLQNPKEETALDAMMFLTGEDFPIWAEIAGLPFAQFTIKNAMKAKKLMKRINRS